MDSQMKLALQIMIFCRVFLCYFPMNYDYPDEYWQGPQIAHGMAFGYGHQTWEWTMQEPIRNPFYQLYLSFGYFIGQSLSLPPSIMEICPKIMQILIAVVSDYFLIQLIHYYHPKIKQAFIYLAVLTNWYYLSMMSRTYINSFQTSLTIVSFYCWMQREKHQNYDVLSRLIVGLNYIARPTSIILWAIVWPYELFFLINRNIYDLMKFILKNITQIVCMVISSFLLGSYYFNTYTLTELNFIKYNIVLEWSSLFGKQSLLFYFYASLPYILGPYLLLLFISIGSISKQFLRWNLDEKVKRIKMEKQKKYQSEKQMQIVIQGQIQNFKNRFQNKELVKLTFLIILILIILSSSTHKEHRFILLIVPFLLIVSTKGLLQIRDKYRHFSKVLLGLVVVINFIMLFTLNFHGKTASQQMLRDIRQDSLQFSINFNQKAAFLNKKYEKQIIYLCDPHGLPGYSLLLSQDLRIKLLDTSPIVKLEGRDETIYLRDSPRQEYDKMLGESMAVDYLIIQFKYQGEMNQQSRVVYQEQLGRFYISQRYQFILTQGYRFEKIYYNTNIWEEYFVGKDAFLLFTYHPIYQPSSIQPTNYQAIQKIQKGSTFKKHFRERQLEESVKQSKQQTQL